jgi:hypothetical protein
MRDRKGERVREIERNREGGSKIERKKERECK